MKTALFAGSFDPITYGHLDIIKTATKLFDKVIVAVACNCNKQGLIPVEKRVELIKECTSNLNNVEVTSFQGLTVNFAKRCNANVLIRGLRNSSDFEYEKEMAQINSKLDDTIQTVCMITKPELSCVSSSGVREIITNGGDVSSFVPDNISFYLKNII